MRLTVHIPGVSSRQAFDAIGDFAQLPEWDPAARSVRIIEGTPLSVGARYQITGSRIGGGITLEYVIDAVDAPHSITYVGGTKHVTTTDTITCDEIEGGTLVAISSVMEFRGPTRWYSWLVRAGVFLGGRLVSLPALKRYVRSVASDRRTA